MRGVHISFMRWPGKRNKLRWTNYEYHHGTNPPVWSGFHIYCGSVCLRVDWSYRLRFNQARINHAQ